MRCITHTKNSARRIRKDPKYRWETGTGAAAAAGLVLSLTFEELLLSGVLVFMAEGLSESKGSCSAGEILDVMIVRGTVPLRASRG